MKLPRNFYGQELVKRLVHYGYETVHQTGSHIIIRTQQNGEHTISVPNHKPLKVGTFSSILTDIADYLGLPKSDVLEKVMARRG